MGIDIGSKFLVGLWYQDFPEEILEDHCDDFTEWAYDHKLVSASPYYDCHYRECFYGFEIASNDIHDIINELKIQYDRFFELVKVPAIVYAGCDVW